MKEFRDILIIIFNKILKNYKEIIIYNKIKNQKIKK